MFHYKEAILHAGDFFISPLLYIVLCVLYVICSYVVFQPISHYSLSFFADVIRLPFTKINSLLCASYKLSKFIELTNI
jgi:hypothetical protein